MIFYQKIKFSFTRFFIVVLLVFSSISILFAQNDSDISTNRSAKDNNIDQRKGVQFGFNFNPGMGKLITENADFEFSFSFNTSIGINILFNNNIGIKTGLNYNELNSKFPIQFTNDQGEVLSEDFGHWKVGSLGLPLKFLLITNGKVGFYFESGFVLYYPIVSKFKLANYDPSKPDTETFVIAEETTIGINLQYNKIGYNLGLFTNYSFTNCYPGDIDSKGLIVGLQLGIIYYRHK